MKPNLISVNRAIFLGVACCVICAVVGAAGGAEYVLRGMDKINDAADAQRAAQDTRDQVAQQSTVAELSAHLRTCEASFATSTLIYESTPQLNVSVTGIKGLPILPLALNDYSKPRWWIPARVTPHTYGDPRGAVYFFTRTDPHFTDGRLLTEGPYVPEVVPQQ